MSAKLAKGLLTPTSTIILCINQCSVTITNTRDDQLNKIKGCIFIHSFKILLRDLTDPLLLGLGGWWGKQHIVGTHHKAFQLMIWMYNRGGGGGLRSHNPLQGHVPNNWPHHFPIASHWGLYHMGLRGRSDPNYSTPQNCTQISAASQPPEPTRVVAPVARIGFLSQGSEGRYANLQRKHHRTEG